MGLNPFVSFILPARNEEGIIARCLRGLQALTYDKALIEIIVVDDGSVDNTAVIARSMGARVLSPPSHVTISALRNFGAREARGEYLAFIDADCVLESDWVRNALSHFRDPQVACVGSRPSIPRGSSWVPRTWELQQRKNARSQEVEWVSSGAFLVTRQAFLEISGFDESLVTCEDVDFCYRLRKKRYKIIADSALKWIHFGEPNTLKDFFRKERWRGQSNYQGLRSHGLHRQEIPSLLLPIYYIVVLLCLPSTIFYSIFWGKHIPFVLNTGLVLLPPLLASLRASVAVKDYPGLARLVFLFLVYSVARTFSLIPCRRAERNRAALQNILKISEHFH